LAYLAAKANGLDEEAASILEASGVEESQVKLPNLGNPLEIRKAVVATHKANWPVKGSSTSAFEKVLLGEEVDEDFVSANAYGDEDGEEGGIPAASLEEAEDEADAEGWDMGEDVDAEVESDFVNVEAAEAGAGTSEADSWARNSPIAADHVAAGSFETAMQLLNRQIGAVNFKPVQWRFEEIYLASRTFLPANPGLPPLVNYVRRNADESNSRKVLPLIPRDVESITTTEFAAGKSHMSKNKLEDGVQTFKRILHLLMINAVSLASEVDEAKKLINTAAQYTFALSMELERRALVKNQIDISSLPEDTRKRALELSAYFTVPELERAHSTLALYAAMKFAHRNKQLSSALSFANSLIERGTTAKFKEEVSCGS
jgi:coatomer protein complex subunit alpha (xenin)